MDECDEQLHVCEHVIKAEVEKVPTVFHPVEVRIHV